MFICWTFADTQFSVSDFLRKHETEFFEVVEPRLSLLRLVHKGVITKDVKSSIDTSNTKDAREVLYHYLTHHATVDTLMEYFEMAIDAEGYPNMQSLGRKMKEELEQGGWLSTYHCACCVSKSSYCMHDGTSVGCTAMQV